MSNDTSTSTVNERVDLVKANAVASVKTSSRCNQCAHCNVADHVGKPTAAQSLKQRWQTTNAKENLSLKQYARQLLASNDADGKALASDWFDHKNGSLNETRNDKNKARIALERQATKSSRKKKKVGGKQEAAPTAV